MTKLKQLQRNEKFRAILKKHKIGWRAFEKYNAFGLGHDYYVDSNNSYRKAINMGKFNGIYDYHICFGIFEQIDEFESKLIDVIEIK